MIKKQSQKRVEEKKPKEKSMPSYAEVEAGKLQYGKNKRES
ncbi:hypothetical protein [Bacillus sp. NPDC077027]